MIMMLMLSGLNFQTRLDELDWINKLTPDFRRFNFFKVLLLMKVS